MNDTLVKLFDWILGVAASFIPCIVHFLISIGTRTAFDIINFESDLCLMLIMYCSSSLGIDRYRKRRKSGVIKIYNKVLVGTLFLASVIYALILFSQDVKATNIFAEEYIALLAFVSMCVLVAGGLIRLGEG